GFEIADRAAFGVLLREILDWRLAQYLSRGRMAVNVLCRVSRNASGQPILFLPSDKSGGLPEGPLEIEVDGRPMEAIVVKIAVNAVRAPGASTNDLPTILREWFGNDAGLPGSNDRVRFRTDGDTVVMEPFGSKRNFEAGAKPWERYSREAIPPAFGF